MSDNNRLKELANKTIENFFETDIDDIVDYIVGKIVETEHIDDEGDTAYLKNRINA